MEKKKKSTEFYSLGLSMMKEAVSKNDLNAGERAFTLSAGFVIATVFEPTAWILEKLGVNN